MNAKAAMELIRDVGLYRLCGTDGCLCMNCEVQGVHVDVSCRKSDGALHKVAPDFYGIKVRVHSNHMDASGADLKLVAEEVVRQLQPEGYAVIVRYCDYSHDSEKQCIYCGALRSDPKGYLCDECLVKPSPWGKGTVADEYDLRRYEFTVKEED